MKHDKITRIFTKERVQSDGTNFVLYYPFTTYSFIFDRHSQRPEAHFTSLCIYFELLFIHGMEETDTYRKSVSSGSKLVVNVERRPSDLCEFAANAQYQEREHWQHRAVQEDLLKLDPKTIATEIPVYDDEWVGHIDIIRWVDGMIEIADFKPNAHKETKAAGQIFRYRNLLAKALNIPAESIRACYFDDKNAYFIN